MENKVGKQPAHRAVKWLACRGNLNQLTRKFAFLNELLLLVLSSADIVISASFPELNLTLPVSKSPKPPINVRLRGVKRTLVR